MAKKRRRRRRMNPIPVIIACMLLVVVILAVVLIVAKLSPTRTVTDLQEYYNLTADSDSERAEAASDELAIVLNGNILEERARMVDGQVYVKRLLLRDEIDERLYYDVNEDLLITTTAEDIITSELGSNTYSVNGVAATVDYAITFKEDGYIYVALDFFDEFSNASHQVYGEPSRVVITSQTGEMNFVDTKKNTQIRVRGGNKSNVVGSVGKGEKLIVFEDLEDWIEVASPQGYRGYIPASAVSNIYTENVQGDYDEPEYTSMSIGEELKLGWGGIYTYAGNERYDSLTAYAGDMNVYSPTWYYLADGAGNLTMFSDSSYVDRAHSDGYQVWALLTDVDSSYVESVLNTTSNRQQLIDNLMSDMEETGIDGINVDFERVTNESSEGFIQFLRELSIRCRAEGKILSVDNYAPYSYNAAAYHIAEQNRLCDYVIIMTYDDYVGTGSIGANSSLPFVEEVMELSLQYIDSSKLVCALPFYSRFWYEEGTDEYSKTEYSLDNAWYVMESNGGSAVWDELLGVYYSEFTEDGQSVYAWLENTESFERKFELLSGYNLAGYAFWQLGNDNSEIWTVIDKY